MWVDLGEAYGGVDGDDYIFALMHVRHPGKVYSLIQQRFSNEREVCS